MLKRHLISIPIACLILLAPPMKAQVPSGFGDILDNVERGKKFHGLWPPVVGPSPLGVIVRANNPKKLIATFESIEHPEYATRGYQFARGETRYVAPEIEKKKEGGVKVDVSELINLLKPANSAATAAPLPGTSAAPSSAAATPPAANAPAPAANAPTPSKEDKALTGVDWSSVSEARRSGGDVAVEWYSLSTLTAVFNGTAVNAPTRTLLTDNDVKVWFMNRVLRMDGVTYELKARSTFAAGFAAGLVRWIPGIAVNRATDTHITLRITSPVYLGYKLWRPGTDPGGAAAPQLGFEGPATLSGELGAEEIAAIQPGS